jgi:hypothetical protein
LQCSVQNPAGASTGNAPAKKDPNAPLPTPLEKLLVDAGAIRNDGSDKFFGFENVSSIHAARSISANTMLRSLAVPGKTESRSLPAGKAMLTDVS